MTRVSTKQPVTKSLHKGKKIYPYFEVDGPQIYLFSFRRVTYLQPFTITTAGYNMNCSRLDLTLAVQLNLILQNNLPKAICQGSVNIINVMEECFIFLFPIDFFCNIVVLSLTNQIYIVREKETLGDYYDIVIKALRFGASDFLPYMYVILFE